MSNVITAAFAGETFLTTSRLWKGDYGQILNIQGLELPEYYEVHFASTKDGTPQVEIGTSAGVNIPNRLLMATGYIYAWLFLHEGEDDGETKYQIKIPVEDKGIPIDQETPEEKTAVQQAIEALNDESGRAEAAAEAAEQHRDDAEDAATLAESWAVGGTGTRTNEDQDNSRFWAQVAQQGAEESGYVWLDINEEDGEMYVTITPNLDRDLKLEINETTGELEVRVYG